MLYVLQMEMAWCRQPEICTVEKRSLKRAHKSTQLLPLILSMVPHPLLCVVVSPDHLLQPGEGCARRESDDCRATWIPLATVENGLVVRRNLALLKVDRARECTDTIVVIV